MLIFQPSLVVFQTGFSGNTIIMSVFYFGGVMMMSSDITVGNLSAFLLYAAYVGISMNGKLAFILTAWRM